MNAALWRPWMRSVAVGVCLFLGICVGSWGLTRWLSNSIENLIETKAVFQVEIEEQRRTVERLKETTWGVVLHEGEEGRRFVVLPQGRSRIHPGPWAGGLPCRYSASEGAL